MDSGYRDVRYTSRVVGYGLCEDYRQSRSVLGVMLSRRDRTCNEDFVSVGELFNQAANTSGVIDRCRKRLEEDEGKAACSGLKGVQRSRRKVSGYAEGGAECIWYVPICAQG